MKSRLNLTIDSQILFGMKAFASKRGTSVSELVEEYFKSITKSQKGKSIIDLIESLEKPDIDENTDLKELFYQEQKEKYGF